MLYRQAPKKLRTTYSQSFYSLNFTPIFFLWLWQRSVTSTSKLETVIRTVTGNEPVACFPSLSSQYLRSAWLWSWSELGFSIRIWWICSSVKSSSLASSEKEIHLCKEVFFFPLRLTSIFWPSAAKLITNFFKTKFSLLCCTSCITLPSLKCYKTLMSIWMSIYFFLLLFSELSVHLCNIFS